MLLQASRPQRSESKKVEGKGTQSGTQAATLPRDAACISLVRSESHSQPPAAGEAGSELSVFNYL